MSNKLLEKLKAIQEGASIDDLDEIMDDTLDDIGDDEFSELFDDVENSDLLSEMAIAIIEAEIGPDKISNFLTENTGMLVRDKLLTEDAVAGKSYVVLSPQARRQRAINIMKLKMARDAGDQRYKKIVIARKLIKELLEKIRNDAKYKKAESIVRKMKFKVVQNPEAVAAMKRAGAVKLST